MSREAHKSAERIPDFLSAKGPFLTSLLSSRGFWEMRQKLEYGRILSLGINRLMIQSIWETSKPSSKLKIAALYGTSPPGTVMTQIPRKAGTQEIIRASLRRKLQLCWNSFKGSRPSVPDPNISGDGVQARVNTLLLLATLLFWSCLGSLPTLARGKLSGTSLQFPKWTYSYGLSSTTTF